jgi:hypothetical protein
MPPFLAAPWFMADIAVELQNLSKHFIIFHSVADDGLMMA